MTSREAAAITQELVERRSHLPPALFCIAVLYAVLGLFFLMRWPLAAWGTIAIPLALLLWWIVESRRYAAARTELIRRGASVELAERAILRQRRRMRRRYGGWSRHDRRRPPSGMTGERLVRWRGASRAAHQSLRRLLVVGVPVAPLFLALLLAINAPGWVLAAISAMGIAITFLFWWCLLVWLRARARLLAIQSEERSGLIGVMSRPIGGGSRRKM